MDKSERDELVSHCLRFIEAQVLPIPLPSNAAEYQGWREKAAVSSTPSDDDEDAWFDLYRYVEEQPDVAWQIICDVAARCRTPLEYAAFAAGPFRKFIEVHGRSFASQINDELARNPGFRMTYEWL